jgi:cobalt-precorrin-5B (C1)-methyltransferase
VEAKPKDKASLRTGYTTGACATAAARAACEMLLTGEDRTEVTIRLPIGKRATFPLERHERHPDGTVTCAVVKDAGDDPDVTHLALVQATVRAAPAGCGVVFRAGPGVGTVTKPGLPLAVGEPAINPAPRRMMAGVVAEVAAQHGAAGNVEVEISIPGGEALATKTWNPRLGIAGGLSILGTTGIVVPFSCSAWIHSIHRGIDVARATGLEHVAGCTGATSEAAVRRLFGLSEGAMIDMGDFAGGMLKYLHSHPVPRLTIGGGFGKLSKLAMGHLDLHSGRSQVDMDWLADRLAELDAPPAAVERARSANSAKQVLDAATALELPLGDRIAALAQDTAVGTLAGETRVDVVIFDRSGELVGRADG